MRTPEEQVAWQQQCFGCSEEALQSIKSKWCNEFHTPLDIAFSMLSDAQEELNFDKERSRKTINRAKWFIGEFRKDMRKQLEQNGGAK